MSKALYLQKNTSDNFLLDKFEKHLRETDHAERSIRSYMQEIRSFSEWFSNRFGNCLKAVSPLDIVEYRQFLQAENKVPGTVNHYLRVIGLFFKWLTDEGLIRDYPMKNVKGVSAAETLAPKWLTRIEQAALMRAVREGNNLRDEAIIGIMLHTGLRVSEVCALDRNYLHIGERSGKVIVRKGKGSKYREVPLNRTVRKILSLWLAENLEGPLFKSRRGSPVSARGVFDIVSKYAYRAKLKDVSPYALRHTFCKNAVDMGVPIDHVAIMAGHSSLDTTKKYTAPSMNDLEAAVEKLAWE